MLSGLLAAAAAVVLLANATCPIEIVSPRLVWMPAALVIASRIAGSAEAGTDLSSSTETCWLSTVPGAIVEWVTVLTTPSEEVVVSCL